MGDLYLATRSPEHLLVRCCDRKMRSCEFLNLKSMVREGESNLFYCKYVQGLCTTEGGSKGDRNEI